MKLSFSRSTKILLAVICFTVSIFGFMIKLPAAFRHFDKELHTVFYFFAAVFLNLLFANRNIFIHLLIFVILYLFGIGIEYAQEYSNTLFHKKIHGRYDIEDVRSNLKGLIACSILWFIYIAISFFFSKGTLPKAANNKE